MNEAIVIFTIALMVLSIIIVMIGKFKDWTYILLLIIIASWLLVYPQALSPYQLGIDAHNERQIAELTLMNGHWNPNLTYNTANGALSIAITAPSITLILGVPFDVVTKFIYSIYPVLLIPVLWKINRTSLGLTQKETFIAILLIVGTYSYMLITMLSRQEVGLFCMVLLISLMFLKKERSVPLTFTILLLFVALTFSHYSTAILFVLIYSITAIIQFILTRDREVLRFVWIGAVMAIFWIGVVVQSTSTNLKLSLGDIIDSLYSMAMNNTSNIVQEQLSPTYSNILQSINSGINYLLLLLMGLGIISLFFYKRGTNGTGPVNKQYLWFCLVAFGLIAVSVLPGVSLVYNAERIYITSLIICSGFAIVGLRELLSIAVKPIRIRLNIKFVSIVVVTLIALSHILLQVGVPQQLTFGETQSKYLEDINQDIHYSLDSEINAMDWLHLKKDSGARVYSDYYGRGFLLVMSYASVPKGKVTIVYEPGQIPLKQSDNLYYFQKGGLLEKEYQSSNDYYKVVEIENILSNKSKVYQANEATFYQ